ncbi:hypothetical protein MRY87_10105 [bacterium]|nr:hypothetical protein [bacterium]
MKGSNEKASDSKEIREEGDYFLDLPDTSDFKPLLVDISLAANIKLCEEMLHIWNARGCEPDNPYAVPFKLEEVTRE